MWLDAERLSEFYTTSLGQLAQRYIAKTLEETWPDVKNEIVVGFGYGSPYLDMFRGVAEQVLSLMPAPQGAVAWPKGRKNLVALVEETEWPLLDQSVDRLMFFHSLEFTDHIREVLQEAWRVIRSGGEILIIAPNRRGAWAQTITTPFGYGTPYTGHQLYDVFFQAGFVPLKPRYCLYTPPTKSGIIRKMSPTLEKLGACLWRKFGGVIMFPAKKQMLGVISQKNLMWAPRMFKPPIPGRF
jgi:SAM-dependent methyltransferase